MPKSNQYSLRYPSEFNSGMPTVTFFGKKYKAPLPEFSLQNPKAQKEDANVKPIVMYLPGDFSENISSSWGLETLLQGSGGNVASIMLANLDKAISENQSKVITSVKAGVAAVPVPLDMLVFQGVNPMQIQFNFKMVPFNQDEGNTIIEICKAFKFNIMPKLAPDIGNAILRFPIVWDIVVDGINGLGLPFTGDGEENMVGYELMALTGCNINYSSGIESAAVYHDKNPVQVNLSLSFEHIKKHWMAG